MNQYLKSIFVLLLFFSKVAFAADIYVSPVGADNNSGAADAPLASLAAAQQKARALVGQEAITIHVADGVYYLPQTLILTDADSGTQAFPVRYVADNEGGAVLSGGSKLELQWKAYQDGVWQTDTPQGINIDQLFINGQNQRMARYPNFDPALKAKPYQGFSADAFSKERAAKWTDPTGGYIHALHRSRWGGYHYQITGKDAEGEVTYEGGWQNNRQMGMHNEFRMVENVFEELDAPGEWFHNQETSTLYFMPPADVDLTRASVEVVRLRHLIELQGSMEKPIRNVSFSGFTFRHSARTFMDTKEPMVRSDWAIYRGGTVMLTGTEDVSITDCEFDQVGGNAIFVNNYNRRTRIKGCHIHDCGASGVCFVGDPNALHNPLFEYGQKNELADISRAVGPKTENYPALGTVEDCLIHGIGTVERQPAGVQIEMAAEITVRDCSVYDCARAGINVGDGAFGGHLIERCDVFDTVLETHDHGSFNSWGRDRYWRCASQEDLDKDPGLPFLDAIKTTVIRDSRWRCDHGWDIDLDDGSSNYDIYNNLMLAGGLKLREGFRRRAWNNITVNNTFHPHVWYLNSDDEVFSNIFMGKYRRARMPASTVYGKRVDSNLIFGASLDKGSGWDKNSIQGDPMFVDPASGDFRVQEGSPALKIGFKNFPMDQFGVKKAELKSIARTPIIPPLEEKVAQTRGRKGELRSKPIDIPWMGASVHTLQGEEFSAYGVSKEDGGVALLKVPENSEAARSGFKVGDVIQGINGQKIADVNDFHKAISSGSAAEFRMNIIRGQQPAEVVVRRTFKVETEFADAAGGFEKLPLPAATSYPLVTNIKTNDEPIESLTDGKLAEGYGPIFANGVANGAYKMDLGGVRSVAAINSWSTGSKSRGCQRLTVYGSSAVSDPGWDLNAYTELGRVDTTGTNRKEFTAASLRPVYKASFGEFRWILWSVSPVTEKGGGENTAFQELGVTFGDE